MTNILNKIVIMVINIDIMKEMFTPDKVDIYHKVSFTFRGVTSLLGEGLVFSEGDIWKKKKEKIFQSFLHLKCY